MDDSKLTIPAAVADFARKMGQTAYAACSSLSSDFLAFVALCLKFADGDRSKAIGLLKGGCAMAEHDIVEAHKAKHPTTEKDQKEGKAPAISLTAILPSWKVYKSLAIKALESGADLTNKAQFRNMADVQRHVRTLKGSQAGGSRTTGFKLDDMPEVLVAVISAMMKALAELSDTGRVEAAEFLAPVVTGLEQIKARKADADPMPTLTLGTKVTDAKEQAREKAKRGGSK